MDLVSLLLTVLLVCILLYAIYWVLTALIHASPNFVKGVMIVLLVIVLLYALGAFTGRVPLLHLPL